MILLGDVCLERIHSWKSSTACSRTRAPSRKSLAPSALPPLDEVLVVQESRSFRDTVSRKACHEFGYTQAQVAVALGLHCSKMIKIIRNLK